MQLSLAFAERPARDDVPGVRVGTCGYGYADWIGPFYPAGTPRKAMLPYYAARFAAVEIDTTYYAVPARRVLAAMAERTPPGFRFSVKAPGAATHLPAAASALPPELDAFRAALEPLAESGKLSCVLLQFPHGFAPSPDATRRLRALARALREHRLVAEFRNRAWQNGETMDLLGELGVGWCNVDLPGFSKLPRPSADAVGPVAYVRFHGRNVREWWRPSSPDARYDYAYRAEELAPWVDRVADLRASAGVRETLAFFNNHRRGQAVRDAALFREMLGARLLGRSRAPSSG